MENTTIRLNNKRRLVYLILAVIVIPLQLFSQDIISSQFISSGTINLGGKAKIQFNINQKTLCDNYTINWDINYVAKYITLTVNYNYFSNCSESISIFTEMPEKQILLTGIYFVKLDLIVPNYPGWNKSYQLGSIVVNPPPSLSCDSWGPNLEDICPNIYSDVCACNGITYINECKSYLEAKKGNYVLKKCNDYLNEKQKSFDCKSFTSSNSTNFFEEYNCENESFKGNEIIFTYHHSTNDPIHIPFTSSENDVKLFLIEISNENLNCIASSENNVLEHQSSIGNFYIIADRIESSPFTINLCDTTSHINHIENQESFVYPNPGNKMITLYSTPRIIKKIALFDIWGKEILNRNVKSDNIEIETNQLDGIFFLKIFYATNETEVRKISILNE